MSGGSRHAPEALGGGEMLEQQRVHDVRVAHVREVGRALDDRAAAPRQTGRVARERLEGRVVHRARHDERRDGPVGVDPEVPVGGRGPALEPLHRRLGQDRRGLERREDDLARRRSRIRVGERRRVQERVQTLAPVGLEVHAAVHDHRRRPALADELGEARVSRGHRADDRDRADAVRLADRDPRDDRAAEREPDDVRPVDRQRIEEADGLVREVDHPIARRRHARATMAAEVVEDRPAPAGHDRLDLRPPHPLVEAHPRDEEHRLAGALVGHGEGHSQDLDDAFHRSASLAGSRTTVAGACGTQTSQLLSSTVPGGVHGGCTGAVHPSDCRRGSDRDPLRVLACHMLVGMAWRSPGGLDVRRTATRTSESGADAESRGRSRMTAASGFSGDTSSAAAPTTAAIAAVPGTIPKR